MPSPAWSRIEITDAFPRNEKPVVELPFHNRSEIVRSRSIVVIDDHDTLFHSNIDGILSVTEFLFPPVVSTDVSLLRTAAIVRGRNANFDGHASRFTAIARIAARTRIGNHHNFRNRTRVNVSQVLVANALEQRDRFAFHNRGGLVTFPTWSGRYLGVCWSCHQSSNGQYTQ